MIKNQKSVRGGIEDFLCPFTDMYITQGSNSNYSHKGIMANDVRGKEVGLRYFIYAPCSMKCVRVYPESGQAMFQSLNKVRFANSRIDYATIMVAHDNTMDCYVGQTFEQGQSFFQMGNKGNATGVHTHIQISQSNDISWFKNEYGIYKFNNEYDLDECYFVDNTNILNGMGGNWKVTSDVEVGEIVDQILHKGSKVQILGTFDVIDINVKENTALVRIDGKEYWLSSTPLLEVK